MKHLILLSFVVLSVVSCGNAGSKKTAEEAVPEKNIAYFPECIDEVKHDCGAWKIVETDLGSIVYPLIVSYNSSFDMFVCLRDNYAECTFYGNDIDLDNKMPKESSITVINEDGITKTFSTNNHTNIDGYDCLAFLNFLIENPRNVTFRFDLIDKEEPVDVVRESLEGLPQVYSYYVKMFHPDLPGKAIEENE